MAEDQLFATLDPTTRRAELPGGGEVLFSDTVGFIQKLPTQLVAAFRATLEEIRDASLLLHVVDVSHPNAAAQVEAVNSVLKDLGVSAIPTLTVWNKLDACADPNAVRAVAAARENTVCVSGRTGEGLDDFLQMVAGRLKDAMVLVHALVPYSQGDLVEEAHRCGVVESAEYTEHGTEIIAHVPAHLAGRLAPLKLRKPVVEIKLKQRRQQKGSANGDEGHVEDSNSDSEFEAIGQESQGDAEDAYASLDNGLVLSEEEELLLQSYYSSEDEGSVAILNKE